MYKHVPRINGLLPKLADLRHSSSIQTVQARELWWVVSGLHQLSGALDHLMARHYSPLMQNPTLIWQERIRAAEDLYFWPVWEERSLNAATGPMKDEEDAEAGFRPDGRDIKRPRTESSTSTFVS
jgi:hypothetical protein